MSAQGLEIGVLGAGSWGTTLAFLLGQKDLPVTLWARRPELARSTQTTRRNELYLPDTLLPPSVRVTGDLEEAVTGRELLVFVVPSRAMGAVADAVRETGASPRLVLSASKGFDHGTLRTMTEVLRERFPAPTSVAALSGPNLAKELADGQPAGCVVASAEPEAASELQAIFTGRVLRAYTASDVLGVELGGALKNVAALATGILTELGLGANTQATLLTRALAEFARLGKVMGASAHTFRGLAGMGDLLATCTSPLSRNHRAGRMAARGLPPEEIRKAIGQAVEGLDTARAAVQLAARHGVELPLAVEINRVLFEGKDVAQAARDLMERPPQAEEEDEEIE